MLLLAVGLCSDSTALTTPDPGGSFPLPILLGLSAQTLRTSIGTTTQVEVAETSTTVCTGAHAAPAAKRRLWEHGLRHSVTVAQAEPLD